MTVETTSEDGPRVDGVAMTDGPPAPVVPPVGAPGSAAGASPGSAGAARARRAALSPSRAKDFLQCPLLFRFRAVDRLPEDPSPAAVRGTLVHAVLERLFDLPAPARTEAAAHDLLETQWDELRERRPELAGMFAGPADLTAWLARARALLTTYFRLENPGRLEPAEREALVETESAGVLLRGFIDRLDVAPNGAVRLVDYKTGRSPDPRFVDEALFQMRFYALMVWRLRGVVPTRLQLVYLGDERTLTHDPHPDELVDVERRVAALWAEITAAARAGRFEARTSRLCGWCSFQQLCPSFGGTPPAVPAAGVDYLLTASASSSTTSPA